jgi:hypothetical protein
MNNVATILILVVAAYALWWNFSRSQALLQKWAQENGYQILRSEYRVFRRGPFFWTSSKGQTVYYVETRDRLGVPRSGWVRCGSWWWGLWSDETEVRWENQI